MTGRLQKQAPKFNGFDWIFLTIFLLNARINTNFRIILICSKKVRFMTKYEKEIYNIITESTQHLTVEQIYLELKKKCPKVVVATVYNNVNKLWKAGQIRKISVENMPDRYDRVIKHDHLVCQKCGRLADISLEDLTASLCEQMGEEFLFYDLKIFYICPDCRKKEL